MDKGLETTMETRCEWCGDDSLYIANYLVKDLQRLLADSGVVRNRLKIELATKNARGGG